MRACKCVCMCVSCHGLRKVNQNKCHIMLCVCVGVLVNVDLWYAIIKIVWLHLLVERLPWVFLQVHHGESYPFMLFVTHRLKVLTVHGWIQNERGECNIYTMYPNMKPVIQWVIWKIRIVLFNNLINTICYDYSITKTVKRSILTTIAYFWHHWDGFGNKSCSSQNEH